MRQLHKKADIWPYLVAFIIALFVLFFLIYFTYKSGGGISSMLEQLGGML